MCTSVKEPWFESLKSSEYIDAASKLKAEFCDLQDAFEKAYTIFLKSEQRKNDRAKDNTSDVDTEDKKKSLEVFE